MNNLNRIIILGLLLGIIYAVFLYQQWTLEEDEKDYQSDQQINYVEDDEKSPDLIDMSDDDSNGSTVYKQDSDLGSDEPDGLSFLDRQSNVSNSSLFF